MFRVTSHRFTQPAVSYAGNHYFPYDGQVNIDSHGKLRIPFCYYDRHRRQWKECTAYLSDKTLIEQLFTYAQKKGLIKEVPDVVKSLLNKEATVAA